MPYPPDENSTDFLYSILTKNGRLDLLLHPGTAPEEELSRYEDEIAKLCVMANPDLVVRIYRPMNAEKQTTPEDLKNGKRMFWAFFNFACLIIVYFSLLAFSPHVAARFHLKPQAILYPGFMLIGYWFGIPIVYGVLRLKRSWRKENGGLLAKKPWVRLVLHRAAQRHRDVPHLPQRLLTPDR
jgi:hypothetical protein